MVQYGLQPNHYKEFCCLSSQLWVRSHITMSLVMSRYCLTIYVKLKCLVALALCTCATGMQLRALKCIMYKLLIIKHNEHV